MEKDHLSLKKVIKKLLNLSKIKTLGTFSIAAMPLAVSSCPAEGHMYR